MTEKLDWETNRDGNQTAVYKGFRIRAEQDNNAENPFEDHDGHWPMVAHYDRYLQEYDKVRGAGPLSPFARFTDELLVHFQKHIEQILPHCNIEEDTESRYCTDADRLRDMFHDEFSELTHSEKLSTAGKLYTLLGIPHLSTTSRGYSQGDWAELLIVATPEAQEELRAQPAGMPDDEWLKVLEKDMKGQADLYGSWAWGDVYGYVVERIIPAADPDDEPTYEDVSDGSCWGYYGDHDESGLEEAAMGVVDYHVRAAAKARRTKLIEMLRNRVPLEKRAALLDRAEEASYA